ncbi:MAG TPA: TA system VapC family ribonuclease toxin [Verrucomicrobiae bacterium]
MRALFDVNVIIALLDPDHAFHERAHAWWEKNNKYGWASCPLTENGVVRIMSNPNYSHKIQFHPADLINRFKVFVENSNHEFWPDNLTLRDEKKFVAERIHSSRQITDLYLLALAAQHHGRLVTFDHNIPTSSAQNAKDANLCVV